MDCTLSPDPPAKSSQDYNSNFPSGQLTGPGLDGHFGVAVRTLSWGNPSSDPESAIKLAGGSSLGQSLSVRLGGVENYVRCPMILGGTQGAAFF